MLTARNLSKNIDGNTLWSGLDLHLEEGDRVALKGPSGSGKTLLMRALSGLDDIDEGDIRYQSASLDTWYLPEFRKHVRYIPQNADFTSGTVYDSITLFFSFKVYRYLIFDESRLHTMLKMLHLPESFLIKTAEHLSGGEKQLVALIRSLLLKPNILLLDEPTSHLDEEMALRVEKLITCWLDEGPNHCFLWTSHDHRQLGRMTRRSIQL